MTSAEEYDSSAPDPPIVVETLGGVAAQPSSEPDDEEIEGLTGMENSIAGLRAEILQKVGEFARRRWTGNAVFTPGRTPIQYAGRVFDEDEVINLVDASLDFWLTSGRFSRKLEQGLADYIGVSRCLLVNSGSSANLLAFSTLTSPRLGDRQIRPGDEVITVATGFPTTVAPIVQYGAVPVFVDADLATAEIDVSMLPEALSERTKAVMVAHTLGNPFNIDAVLDFCERHGLWLVEDNCDALGSEYTTSRGGSPETRRTGSFGHLATSSFYPAHHITTGEGGAVYVDDEELAVIAESIRDWGRDCYCKPGRSNTCGMRFDHCQGQLPEGYDHKYTYSHFGYNLKMTDLQAAVGVAQLGKLPGFVATRQRNFDYIYSRLAPFGRVLRLPEPTPASRPSWFGFLVSVKDNSPVTRDEIVAELEEARVQTRMLFGGNLLRQPCFDQMRSSGTGFRSIGDLPNADRLMRDAFWFGVYPGMDEPQMDHICSTIERLFVSRGVTPATALAHA